PCQGMPGQPHDEVWPAKQQASLRAAEQLVTAGGHQVSAGAQPRRRVRFVGQRRVRREQPRPDVADDRNAKPGELGYVCAGSEAVDAVVRWMDLEYEAGPLTDRRRVVSH